ncbi:MAG: glutamine-hydrolyzing carbamoyl-phosphate synthase small subunit, partial [Sulfuricaulis sp.]|nr:glutamine-hydrolyzing carbamoyl-phosphate synthase small subunit [Sulfuricaulis sp.]
MPSALLALEDGSLFYGESVGVPGQAVGEVVFNTAMTGYQEILTDPSYARQIVTLTYPHIGNTGANPEDMESPGVYATGLVIRDLPLLHSNFRAAESLAEFIRRHKLVGIAGIDTRRLTRLLREKGAQNGCILAVEKGGKLDKKETMKMARAFPGLKGMDLAKVVTTKKPYTWEEGLWELGKGHAKQENPRFHVVACDYGIKRNILRMLAARGCRLTVVPAQTSAEEILKMKPDGVFLSNGPGDPEPCAYAIEAIRHIIDTGLPVFGICLGHQLMGLA